MSRPPFICYLHTKGHTQEGKEGERTGWGGAPLFVRVTTKLHSWRHFPLKCTYVCLSASWQQRPSEKITTMGTTDCKSVAESVTKGKEGLEGAQRYSVSVNITARRHNPLHSTVWWGAGGNLGRGMKASPLKANKTRMKFEMTSKNKTAVDNRI